MGIPNKVLYSSGHDVSSISSCLSDLHHDTLLEIYQSLIHNEKSETKKFYRYPSRASDSEVIYVIRNDFETVIIAGSAKEEFIDQLEKELYDSSGLVFISLV